MSTAETRRRGGALETMNDTLQPLFENRNMEIDKQSDRHSGELQIRQQLRIMDRQQFFDGFELNHNQVFDNHIHLVAAIKLDSLVDDWQRNLSLDPKPLLNHLVSYSLLVGRFKQTWTQDTVTSIAQRIRLGDLINSPRLRVSAVERS